MSSNRPPICTYRLQLSPEFDFDAARQAVPYLAALGVSHLYLSPILQAVPGSAHGYDVVDPRRISDELGGDEGFARLRDAARQHGLGLLIDIVPNHLAAHASNPWWWDLLKNGRRSPYAPIFDVAWNPPEPRLRGKILLPVLGDHYGRVLEAGELRLEARGEEAVVRYHELAFPIAPESIPGDPDAVQRDPDRLDRLLRRQHYRLAYWRTAARELDYRRFFDIASLVGVRVEDRRVFEATHGLVRRWLQDGVADGVRIDHLDGLRDPQGYLEQLRYEAPGAWLVAEKVLLPGEAPPPWLEATTGYDFLNQVLGLFIDPAGEAALTALWQEFGGEEPYPEILHRSQLEVLRTWLGSELARVVDLLLRIGELRRRYRDFTRHELHEAVAELVAAFPVYRTYVRRGQSPRPEDRAAVEQATAETARRRPDLDPELLRLLRDLLLGRYRGRLEAEFGARFQQLTGAAQAKGGEDTALYRYHRLLALNEVGGDPGRFGVSAADFHAANRARLNRPLSLNATSTHDAKRGEDVRARLALLSEVPELWAGAVRSWSGGRHGFPDRPLEYLFHQTLLGAWPLSLERALLFMEKAAREAKTGTSWTDPDPDFERRLKEAVERAFADPELMRSVAAFSERLAPAAEVNGLAMKLLALTSPGVPDLYQGSEVWNLNLVDPDNRRPVDFGRLQRLGGDHPKQRLVKEVLRLRPRFAGSGYRPLEASPHLLGFARGAEAVVVVPRLWQKLGGYRQGEVELPPGRWSGTFGGGRFSGRAAGADLLAAFPVELLVPDAA